jgi:hypothetical protein
MHNHAQLWFFQKGLFRVLQKGHLRSDICGAVLQAWAIYPALTSAEMRAHATPAQLEGPLMQFCLLQNRRLMQLRLHHNGTAHAALAPQEGPCSSAFFRIDASCSSGFITKERLMQLWLILELWLMNMPLGLLQKEILMQLLYLPQKNISCTACRKDGPCCSNWCIKKAQRGAAQKGQLMQLRLKQKG